MRRIRRLLSSSALCAALAANGALAAAPSPGAVDIVPSEGPVVIERATIVGTGSIVVELENTTKDRLVSVAVMGLGFVGGVRRGGFSLAKRLGLPPQAKDTVTISFEADWLQDVTSFVLAIRRAQFEDESGLSSVWEGGPLHRTVGGFYLSLDQRWVVRSVPASLVPDMPGSCCDDCLHEAYACDLNPQCRQPCISALECSGRKPDCFCSFACGSSCCL